MPDATDRGIISEHVAALWDVHTEILIQAIESRGYKVLTLAFWDHLADASEELAAIQARLDEVDPDG